MRFGMDCGQDAGMSRNEMNGVLGYDSALLKLYWGGDNVGL